MDCMREQYILFVEFLFVYSESWVQYFSDFLNGKRLSLNFKRVEIFRPSDLFIAWRLAIKVFSIFSCHKESKNAGVTVPQGRSISFSIPICIDKLTNVHQVKYQILPLVLRNELYIPLWKWWILSRVIFKSNMKVEIEKEITSSLHSLGKWRFSENDENVVKRIKPLSFPKHFNRTKCSVSNSKR